MIHIAIFRKVFTCVISPPALYVIDDEETEDWQIVIQSIAEEI